MKIKLNLIDTFFELHAIYFLCVCCELLHGRVSPRLASVCFALLSNDVDLMHARYVYSFINSTKLDADAENKRSDVYFKVVPEIVFAPLRMRLLLEHIIDVLITYMKSLCTCS